MKLRTIHKHEQVFGSVRFYVGKNAKNYGALKFFLEKENPSLFLTSRGFKVSNPLPVSDAKLISMEA